MTEATIPQLNQIQLDDSRPHMGDLFWFSLAEIRVDPDCFKKLLRDNNFDEELCPSYHHGTSLNRILRGKAQRFKEHILRMISNTNRVVSWGIVRENKEETKQSLRHEQVGVITLDPDSGRLSFRADTIEQEKIDAARAIFDETSMQFNKWMGNLSDQEVRPVLTHLLKKACSLTIRESGGVYFIPHTHKNYSRGMYNIIKTVGNSTPCLMPIYEDVMSKEVLQTAARNTIEDELRQLKEEIESFTEKTRDATVKDRLQLFEDIRQKTQLYSTILKTTADDLVEKIDGLKKQAEQIIEQKGLGILSLF